MAQQLVFEDMVTQVKGRMSCNRDEALRAVEAVYGAMSACVCSGQDLKVKGLGTFKIGTRKGCIKSVLGQKMEIPERPAVRFKPAREVKESLQRLLDGLPLEHHREPVE